MIEVKFRLEYIRYLFYHWENAEPTISRTTKGLEKPLSHNVLKYFQLRNAHFTKGTHLQALEHIT